MFLDYLGFQYLALPRFQFQPRGARRTDLHQPSCLQVSQNSAKAIWSFIPLAACPIHAESNRKVQLVQCEENSSPLVLSWFDQRLFRSLVGHDAELKCHRLSPLTVLESTFGAVKPYICMYAYIYNLYIQVSVSEALVKNLAVHILDQNPVLLQSRRNNSASWMMINDAKSHPLKHLPLRAGHISMVTRYCVKPSLLLSLLAIDGGLNFLATTDGRRLVFFGYFWTFLTIFTSMVLPAVFLHLLGVFRCVVRVGWKWGEAPRGPLWSWLAVW